MFCFFLCVCVVNRTVSLPTDYENLKRAITVHMLWYKLFFSIWLKSMLYIFMWHKGTLKETCYFDRGLVSWNNEVSGVWRCLEQLRCTLFHQGPHIRSTERKWSRWKRRSHSESNWITVPFVCGVKMHFGIFQTFGPMTDTTEEEVENKQKKKKVGFSNAMCKSSKRYSKEMSFNHVCLQINQSQVLGDQLRLCHPADFSVPQKCHYETKVKWIRCNKLNLGFEVWKHTKRHPFSFSCVRYLEK